MTEETTAARRLHLALAAVDGALPVEALVASGLWEPAQLWMLVEDARAAGKVAPDPSAGRGCLRWVPLDQRDAAVAAASPEDLAALLAHAPFPDRVLEAARTAAKEHQGRRAGMLYAAVSAVPDRRLFTGGEPAWVAAMVEHVRWSRSAHAIPPATLDAAFALAESQGDLPAQAVLLAARGLQWLAQDATKAQELFRHAEEAADASNHPATRAEVRTYVAVSLVLSGRLQQGIAAFEAMLGDVEPDPLDGRAALSMDLQGASPATALGLLAFAYVGTGDQGRALDILERIRSQGAQHHHAVLEARGELFLALAFMMLDDAEAARPHAERAQAFWASREEPASAWYSAQVLAFVRAAEGRLEEARTLLLEASRGWTLSQRPWAGGSPWLLLLERLEQPGQTPPELDVEREMDRHILAGRPFFAGVAHRVRARRVLARGAAEPAAVHLERAVALLQEAGARPELRAALEEAAQLAQQQERPAQAVQWQAQAASMTAPDVRKLTACVLELGRLSALDPPRPGLWGEVMARMCRDLGAERGALVELTALGPQLLAFRGSQSWQEALLEHLRHAAVDAVTFHPALLPRPGPVGQLVLVPFLEPGQRGVVALENRDTPARVGPADAPWLPALGQQLGILRANVALWKEQVEARARLEGENRCYRETAPSGGHPGGRIMGSSRAMQEVLERVRRVAPTTASVLVTGETGVGKELVAREVHLLSPRAQGPFLAVHVAALAPGLVASALFGHERGAFTGATTQSKGRFELAHGGTLFLDEVGELAPEDQVRLLRVLQEGTFERVGGTKVLRSDFRLVAATNRDLPAEVRAGRFREDLYFRLSTFPLRVPPLRERREEIPTLALYFLERSSRKLGVRFDGIPEADMARLVAHPWPGNVRELEHVVERAVLLSDPPRLRVPGLDPAVSPAPRPPEPTEWLSMEEMERRYIGRVLEHTGGRINGAGGAADLLQVKPSTLQSWIDKLDLRDVLARARGTVASAKPRH